jgi:outer membrane lipoprotein-sorting protein
LSLLAPRRTRLRRFLAPAALLASVAWGAPAVAEEDPWRLLAAVRERLAAEPRIADFVQTYVPAGFSSGESESGTVAFDLPERVRWDYVEPYPRSFLVAGVTVYAWSAGDEAGRRLALDSAEARHLDLLRLDAVQLAQRYVAERITAPTGDGVEVVLTPLASDSEIAEARIAVDPELAFTSLSYRDREGNATRFELSPTRRLDDTSRLVPPPLEWREP